jgi:hypothetical protein
MMKPRMPATNPDELVRRLADFHDRAGQGEGLLADSVVRRLHARQATSGKTCERCQVRKRLSGFSLHRRNTDALRNYCKECANIAERRRVNGKSGAPVALSTTERENT